MPLSWNEIKTRAANFNYTWKETFRAPLSENLSMKGKRISRKVILALIALAVLIPLILYLLKFGSTELSKNFNTWVSFANYWSPFLTLATAAYTLVIALEALKQNEKVEAPLITFEMVNLGSNQYYIIKNAGKVPALNCMLLVKKTNSEQVWDQTINCYVIKPDEVKVISWIPYLKKARMHYENFSGIHYTTTIESQHNNFTKFNKPEFKNFINYSEVSNQNLEDEILKSLIGSSENKDDFRMVVDLLLNKAKDCNEIYLKYNAVYGNDHSAFTHCLNEIIISQQILSTIEESIGTNYLKERKKDILKLFWIQLDIGIRLYIKDCHFNKPGNFPIEMHKLHLDSIHSTFSKLYENY